MNSRLKTAIALALVFLPKKLKPMAYRILLGYRIHPSARIGFSYLCCQTLTVGAKTKIGHFNRIKGPIHVKIGSDVNVLTGNTWTGSAMSPDGCVTIGDHCGVSIGHYFDAHGAIDIAEFTTIAGVGSQFFTHNIDVQSGSHKIHPVKIGKYCLLGSACRVLPGATVSNYTVVAMGAVVPPGAAPEFSLLAGVPATVKRQLSQNAAYFSRDNGQISEVAP